MQKLIKKKRIPFFRNGSLVFKSSGHRLRVSDRHYRCNLSCQGKCKLKEPQIKTDTLQKSFVRITESFRVDSLTIKKIHKELLRGYFVDILLNNLDEKDGHQDIVDTTVVAMNKDIQVGSPFEKTDIIDIEKSFVQIQQLDYPILLFGYLLGFVVSLSKDETPTETARNLALISKNIFLSDDGQIVAIEFERWGWYALNYVAKQSPDFFNKIKGVEIINGSDDLAHMELSNALNYFNTDNFDEALHNHEASETYLTFKMMKDMTLSLISGDSSAMQKALVQLMTQLTQIPVAEFATKIAPVVGLKNGKYV